jgi:tagatose 6-phosphate kinase
LGVETTAVGFLGREDIQLYQDRVGARGVHLEVTAIAATRTNWKVIERDTGLETELNDAGVPVTSAELSDLRDKLRKNLPRADWIVMSGSLAPNVPSTIYAELVREANAAGVHGVVDTSGDFLRVAVQECPRVLRINRAELAELTEGQVSTLDQVAQSARQALNCGSEFVNVSLGAEGAVLAHHSGCWYARPPKLNVVNAIGAGDVMSAGLVDAWQRGLEPPEVLRWATALASASVLTLETGEVDPAAAREIEKQVEVRQV